MSSEHPTVVSEKNGMESHKIREVTVTIKAHDLTWLNTAFLSYDKGRKMAKMEPEIDGSRSIA